VRRKAISASLAGLLILSLLGCGTSNHLQSITLVVTEMNGQPVKTQTGFYDLLGLGGTVQFAVLGNYSSGKQHDLTTVSKFTMIVDPDAPFAIDGSGGFYNLPDPPLTAQISTTGLVTAVEPAACSWLNSNPDGDKPAWAYVGDYKVTASFQGLTSQPIYLPLASAAGIVSNSNPTGACGP